MGKLGTEWRFEHKRDGEVIWESDPIGLFHSNALADEGEKSMLDVYFAGTTPLANLYVRLYNDTPVDTDTLATLTGEVTGTGYAAITLARGTTDWPTVALDSGDFRASSLQKTWTAGGAWTAATYAVLASVASGTSGLLIAYTALGATRTLVNTDELNFIQRIKLA